ncbi:MAG: hypothetical protein J5925_06895, partial [Clostridia bacterium]|nr:hypothetical protein [Clostridia bacterium]
RASHRKKPPKVSGSEQYAVTARPQTYSPSTHPQLALKAGTRSFIDLPLCVFLGTLSAAKGQLGYCAIVCIITQNA